VPTSLSPYLGFAGNAREAMEFYRSVFGGELETSTYADFQASEDPADQDRLMHSQLTLPNGLLLMASDSPSAMEASTGSRIQIALFGEDDAELSAWFAALAEGGEATMPLTDSPWGDRFGMLVDRYGIEWMVNISPASD
jgi:PhnB protein